MHSVRHPKNGNDAVYAQAGPVIYNIIDGNKETLLKTMNDPSLICTIPTPIEIQNETVLPRRMEAINYDNLRCNYCNSTGTLELNWSVDDDLCNGMCPKCKQNGIVAVFADTC